MNFARKHLNNILEISMLMPEISASLLALVKIVIFMLFREKYNYLYTTMNCEWKKGKIT
jgi:hypothetical protein